MKLVQEYTIYNIFITMLTVLGVSMMLQGCKSVKNGENTLVVSIAPLKFIIEEITCSDFPVEILVPEGASPETYSPTPSQIRNIESSRLTFVTGLVDFEKELITRLPKQLQENNIVLLGKGVLLLDGGCGHDHEHDRTHGSHSSHNHGVDPHIWTSPESLKIMAENAYNAIMAAFPDSIKYRESYERLTDRIDTVSASIRTAVNDSSTTHFLIYHPALGYYARDYGLMQISLENEGKEPSAAHMQDIIKQARQYEISTILYQREFSQSVVESIARELDLGVVEIAPLSEDILGELLRITSVITNNAGNE